MLGFLIDNICLVFGVQVFQQTVGIPMGTNCAFLLADLFLYSYEAELLKKNLYVRRTKHLLWSSTQHLDILMHDVLSMSQKSSEDTNQETRQEHEQSEKHKEMVKFYQHFLSKYLKEISEVLGEVRGFIQQHKLGTAELVEKHFKEETYNIRNLCRQRDSVETKIESIIKGCAWQNEEIWGEVHEMTGSYHSIKDYVETEACKRKERSEKQRDTDLAKNKQEILDDDMEAIEPVVEEPKERRPKGRGKRKSQRR